MKRDLDLCRELMLAFETQMLPGQAVCTLRMPAKFDAATVFAHISLLTKAELLEGRCSVDPENPAKGGFVIHSITWTGYDFIDAAQKDTVWAKSKTRLKKAGSWTFSLLMDVLKDEAQRQLGGLLP